MQTDDSRTENRVTQIIPSRQELLEQAASLLKRTHEGLLGLYPFRADGLPNLHDPRDYDLRCRTSATLNDIEHLDRMGIRG